MADADLVGRLGELLEEAKAVALRERFRLQREQKPDGSVVTSADRAVEKLLRQRLPALISDAGFWGEEEGLDPGPEGTMWLVDPVDGTTNFACGSPLWGISIGFIREGEIVLGGVALPDLEETYLAAKGAGVTLNGKPLPPIPPGEIVRADPVSYCESVARLGLKIPGRMRCAGAFVVDGAFVAGQRLRGMVGVREKLYDIAPCVLFCRELGGDVRYADDSPFVEADLCQDIAISKPWLLFPRDSGFAISG